MLNIGVIFYLVFILGMFAHIMYDKDFNKDIRQKFMILFIVSIIVIALIAIF